MPEVATIADVAGRAGVSVATVSRALRGLPHVSPATREHVRRVAAELDYRANPHASRLAAGRSGTVGVALPVLNSWFYRSVLAGVEAVLSGDLLDMHLFTIGGDEGMERFIAQLPSLSKRVDGLIVVDLFMPDQLWEDVAGGHLPMSTVGVDTGRFDSVTIDNVRAAREAVSHLLDLGHRRIGFIGAGAGESLEFESAEQRRRGMVEALAAYGVEPDPELEVAGAFSVHGGREAMSKLMGGNPPTAVFCTSDEMAIGALWAVNEARLSIPVDVSLVGFDDQPVAEALGLTTVHQPVGAMAARAASMVLDRVAGEVSAPIRLQVPTRLQIRQTTTRLT